MSGDSAPDMATQPESEIMDPIDPIIIKKAKSFTFVLHGVQKKVCTEGLNPSVTLNDYIRNELCLTGTKYMCKEGGCGVCIVSVSRVNPRTNVKETFAVNSCLVSILSVDGWDITTIEKLGNRHDGYHPIQQKIVQFNGTQCGFCTPGMVMNMHALMESGKTSMKQIEDAFGGNICRCTGYRPILAAFKSMARDSDEALLGIVPDIEELQLCKKPGCERTCPTPCAPGPLYYDLSHAPADDLEDAKQVWYKAAEIKDIFAVINARSNRDRTYRLVAGNTARGVYPSMDKKDYYIDIGGVAELRTHALSTKNLAVGANCTLAETIDIFKDVATRDEGFKHLVKLAEHLELVANVPVRNIGTLAGNLCIKKENREFPSDIFLIFEAVGAKIVLDNGESTRTISVLDFLDFDMTKRIMRRFEFPPLDSSFRLETYKVMPRAQNAHAYVNAAFLMRTSTTGTPGTIQVANIVYGGISPTFVHATRAEAYVRGKSLFQAANLTNFFQQLAQDINPDHVLPDPSPEYRKQLAIALAYKFVLSMSPEASLSPMMRSGGLKLERGLSNGVQQFTTNESMYPIGKPINKLEAADQASGAAKYPFDIPDAHQQLFAVFVVANYPAGSKLTGLNPGPALELKGVEAFFKAEDIPGVNSFLAPNTEFFYQTDEHLFIRTGDSLKFFGQPVGLIVAETMALATTAAGLVQVTCDSASVSPTLTAKDVVTHDIKPRIIHIQTVLPKVIPDTKPPVEFTGSINMGCQYHNSMEMQVIQVTPTDDGGLYLQPSTQWVEGIQWAVANVLKLPANKITITVKRVGGSFGSKLTRSNWTACAASLAAYKLNRPVKMCLTLEENMNIIGKRNPFYGTYEVGTDLNGKIMYLNYKVYNDVGAYHNTVPLMQTLDALSSNYISDSFEIEYNLAVTDTPASTWTRAPGAVEGIAMLEIVLEHIAYKTGKDPVDVRLANLNLPTNATLKKMFDEFIPWADYRARRAAVDAFNANNRWRKRGLAVMPISIGLAFLVNHYSQISIYRIDGTVAVSHGGIEIGQGINTKVAQAVAYELNVPIEMVYIRPTDNMTSPNTFATGGALTTESVVKSVRDGCTALKARIQWAKEMKNLPDDSTWLQLVQNAYALGRNLSENTMQVIEGNHDNQTNNRWVDNPAAPSSYIIYGIGCTEVEVDLLTGTHIVQRVDIMEDVGDSLSPWIDIGQVEGAFIMGMGYWTTEKTVYDHDGRNLTNRTWTYKPPGAKDIPVTFNVKFPTGQPNPQSPYKNKATSEPPTCLGFSVALAIKDALKTARSQASPSAEPWVPVDGPFTVESIFMNSMMNSSQYRLN